MQTIKSFRQSEFGVVLVDAWRWWISELAALTPKQLRRHSEKVPHADIRLSHGAVEIDVVENGVGRRFAEARRIEDLDEQAWGELQALVADSRARIVLRPPDCFVTNISLPKAARKHLRSAVALQLSLISPIEPKLLQWEMEAIGMDDDGVHVRVAMVNKARIDALRALFEANGIVPPPICAETPGQPLQLAAGDEGRRPAAGIPDRKAWAIAAMLLVTIPFTTFLGAKLLQASAQSRIAALEHEIAPKIDAESSARRSEDARRALRPVLAHPSVSETLEDIAARLPLTDHVKRIERTDIHNVQFTVETAAAEAVVANFKESETLHRVAIADLNPAANGRIIARYEAALR